MAPTSKKRPAPNDRHLPAIYVHAGAGYHSVQNEHIHLKACAESARTAMACLRGGGSALDAVELAIKTLEDNDVTNAGYGSNLTAEGNVEGDATIVDHFGRSGAVGAIGRVSNPIHTARMVYERSITPMPLRRVPPNLLVGDGAVDFAHEHGISILPNECLVSEGARDRFEKWKVDIEAAEAPQNLSPIPMAPTPTQHAPGSLGVQSDFTEEEQRVVRDFGPAGSRNPTTAALANESQAFSPSNSSDNLQRLFPSPANSTPSRPNKLRRRSVSRAHADGILDTQTEDPLIPFSPGPMTSGLNFDPTEVGSGFDFGTDMTDGQPLTGFKNNYNPYNVFGSLSTPVVSTQGEGGTFSNAVGVIVESSPIQPSPEALPPQAPPTRLNDSSSTVGATAAPSHRARTNMSQALDSSDDMISDTVGAIAVDSLGNIAAASSSGGIGMKHRGRVGPAALVGVGTAVIPLDPSDPTRTTVACVTSGTGEHMATSLAAGTCAQRLYSSTKLAVSGRLAPCDDDEAMQSFIRKDFMGHPSVRNSTTGGAIGVMAVKKDVDGMWLYFAHNTDSFALASMHAADEEPNTVMSRTSKGGKVTSGGRSMRVPASGGSGSAGAAGRAKGVGSVMGRMWRGQGS